MNLQERDKKHLWHPLTQHHLQNHILAIVKAKGALLYDENNIAYIDGIASWYTAMYGHCHDYIIEKVQQQMQQTDQIVFAGFTHKPAIELSEQLIEILPDNQEKIFFSDNGSTANEVAIKMAIQYHHNQGEKRQTIIAFENGFHGDTFGAMSVSGLSVYNGVFEDLFIDVKRIAVPNSENIESILAQLRNIICDNKIAAFIYEPLVQGANAMHMYSASYLDKILNLCKDNNVITIADEVMTGFGKTGKLFASEFMLNQPDIMCLSKALSAGFVPLAVTTCTIEIYKSFLSDDFNQAFLHAHTYTANPIACSAALAGIKLLRSKSIQDNALNIIQSHQKFDRLIRDHSMVDSTRQLGVIYAIDLNIDTQRYGNKRNEIFHFFMARGVCLRPLGRTVYILPPYVIENEQLQHIYSCIVELLDELRSD